MPMSEEGRRVIAEANRRRVWTSEQLRDMSERMIGRTYAKGHTHEVSEATRRAISEANTGRVKSKRECDAISRTLLGRSTLTEFGRRAKSAAMMGNTYGYNVSEEGRQAISRARMGKVRSVESRRLQSESLKAARAAMSREEKDERARNVMLGNHRKPTEPEWLLGFCLERRFPKEWAYNGDGNKGLIVGGKTPDFININGKKAVIEVFGSYHHDTDIFPNKETPRELMAHYAELGFDCLVLWDYECYDSEELVQRVGELRRVGRG
ncbi:hypothetical protein LCGC14_1378930 [marine sediment metagenome]|uniref:Nuclease associated modular domain-containing protein n=1 Tax=marine sediment metagenome TaxID=412755 RepID=A0A0F9K3B8_9ZZZZ